jgi:hypothetical protein
MCVEAKCPDLLSGKTTKKFVVCSGLSPVPGQCVFAVGQGYLNQVAWAWLEKAGALPPVERITQKKNTRKEYQMDHRSEGILEVKETCIVCREAAFDQIFGELCCEHRLPGELKAQEYTILYGMCKKCIKDPVAFEIFNVLMDVYEEMLEIE